MANFHAVQFTIIEAKDVVDRKGNPVDAYCKIKAHFLPAPLKTKTSEKTSNPQFKDSFTIQVPDKQKLKKGFERIIQITAFKPGLFSDKSLGECSINLQNDEDLDVWLKLSKKKDKTEVNRPSIHVSLVFKDGAKKDSKDGKDKDESVSAFQGKEVMDEKYIIQEEIGQGSFSVVFKGLRKETGEVVAIKKVNKSSQFSDQIKLLRREIQVMQKLSDHPNVVKLYDVFEDDKCIYMVIEYMTGGELYDHIIQRGSFTESDAADIVKQILSALTYIHHNGIGHRDLKPENLLCSTSKGDVVKIADFGLSKDFSDGKTAMKTCCGSPSYVAPEVLEGLTYDHECDIWSLGVITYVLLSGCLPFFGDTQDELFQKIMNCDYTFNYACFRVISDEAKDFIRKCLVIDPHKRWKAEDLMKHPWICPENESERKQEQLQISKSLSQITLRKPN